ncbi:hypothetical protein HMPREF1554_00895, partial [Porphyromonas gingivalis F0569]
MQTHLNEPFAKREGYQEVSFRYRFCSPIERVAQVMEERGIHIYNDTEKQSIDNEI